MIWKDINGCQGLYQVNRYGDVISVPRIAKNRFSFRITKSKNIKSRISRTGYLYYPIKIDNKLMTFYKHRLIAEHYIPNPLNLPEVNHINGVKTDNRIGNLEWCTSKENIKHAIKIGLISIGEDKCNAKLTNMDVCKIRRMRSSTNVDLASMFGVSSNTISRIRHRKSWKHLA